MTSEPARPVRVIVPRELLESMADPDPCWFDHHGGCQAHGYNLEPGEVCPQVQLAAVLAAPPLDVLVPGSVHAGLDAATAQRCVTEGRPEDGPYPATVGEVADEVVQWLTDMEVYACDLRAEVARRLSTVPHQAL